MVQGRAELGPARAAETRVEEGKGVSSAAVDVGNESSKVLDIIVSNLGPSAHDHGAEDNDGVLAFVLVLLGAVDVEELVS